jgi:ribosome maturation factor RimP
MLDARDQEITIGDKVAIAFPLWGTKLDMYQGVVVSIKGATIIIKTLDNFEYKFRATDDRTSRVLVLQ